MPDWFSREREHAERHFGRRESLSAKACLKATFYADGLGTMVPSLPLGRNAPNHEASWELITVANLALWVARPSSLHLDFVITAEPEVSSRGSAVFGRTLDSILPHEKYAEASLKRKHLALADRLASAIQTVPGKSSVWTAIRFLSHALTQEAWESRLISLWVAIEALFGPEDGVRIKKRLSTRIAMFLNSDINEAHVAHALVREGYEWRCAAVHGGRLRALNPEQSSEVMLNAEGIVLTTLRKILLDPALVSQFCSVTRDDFLDTLAKGYSS